MTVLSAWLDAGLARRLAFWAIAITAGALLLGMIGGVAGTAWSVQRQHEADARRDAARLAESVAATLAGVGVSVAALVNSSLVVNGLSDASSLESTVQPLLAEHELGQRFGAVVQLCDAFRRVVAGGMPPGGRPAVPAGRGDDACGDSGDFERALAGGAQVRMIGALPGAVRMRWIVPVKLPATGTYEGAIVAWVPMAAVLRAAVGPDSSSVTLQAGGKPVTAPADTAGARRSPRPVSSPVPFPLPPGVAPLGLEVVTVADAAVVPWAQIVGGYALVALVLASVAGVAAVLVARRLTAPYEAIGQLAVSAGGMQSDAWLAFATRRDEAGQLARRLHDLTLRLTRQLNELREARNVAEEASQAKTEFLATMSHELRTPLNAVTGLAALALDAGDDDRRAHLEQLQRSAARLRLLVDDVLDLGRIESGRLELAPTACAVAEIVAAVRDATLPAAAAKSLPLAVEIASGVPPVVRADPLRVVQVLVNLVANAIKFTERGEVRLRVATDGSVLRFEVTDTGIGIAADDLPRIFEAFRQADASTARRYGGSGLGLTISRRLVELMAGRIEVHSVPGEGSRFEVILPLVEEGLAAASPAKRADAAAELRRCLGAKAVLLVEDDDVNRLLARVQLEHLGVAVLEAGGGSEALEVLQAQGHRIGLVLMDCHMPGMDGYEATRRLRADTLLAHLPVVACTADVLTEGRDSCREAGMDDYVSKPIERDSLVEAMIRSIGARRQVAAEAPPV